MKNSDLARRIKDLRRSRGFSQEELAEKACISLRTVQRIENAETEGRGDTIKRLANALNITTEELADQTEHEDKTFLALLNLSALSFMAFPLLGIIIPLTLWVLKKDKIKHINDTGKKLLNFQISWCILLGLHYFLVAGPSIFQLNFHFPSIGSLGRPDSIILIFVLLYLFNSVLILVNATRSWNAKMVFYRPAIAFFR